jgi:hypothetical protein
MTQLGLSDEEVTSLVNNELLSLGRYTLTQPSGRPVFTKEQRDAIGQAVAAAIRANNEALIQKLREAGVAGL